MAAGNSSMNRIKALQRDCAAPVLRALYARDAALAHTALAQARTQVSQHAANVDEACAAEYLLACLEYTVARACGPPGGELAAHQELLRRLQDSEPAGEASQTVRRVQLLSHRLRGERHGISALAPDEFYALFNFIPAEERDLELWHDVAGWAFSHGERALLERACEVFVAAPTGAASQYRFHRAKLMHGVLQGQVALAEFAGYCARLASQGELDEARRLIWPRLAGLGLGDGEAERLLAQAEARIAQQALEMPA
jgi:hypothetical protein